MTDYSSQFVNYRDFDVDRLVTPEKPELTATKSKPRPGEAPADEIIIRYRYPMVTKDGKELDNPGILCVQGPEMLCRPGIMWKPPQNNPNGEKKPFIPVTFDMNDEDQAFFVGHPSSIYRPQVAGPNGEEVPAEGFIGALYTWCCERFYDYRKYQKGSKSFQREMVPEMLEEKLILTRRLYKKDDKPPPAPELIDKEVPGANPGKFYKIRTFGTRGTPSYSEARFVAPNGEVIKLSDLGGMKIKFIPLILYRHIWLGNILGITGEVISAIVTDVQPAGSVDGRIDVVRARWLDTNPELVTTTVKDAILRIKAEKAAAEKAALEEVDDSALPTVTKEVLGDDDLVRSDGEPDGDGAIPVKTTAPPKPRRLVALQGMGAKVTSKID